MDKAILQYDPQAFAVDPTSAVDGWVTMTVLGAAAKAGNLGDHPTSAALEAGLNTIKNDTFGGLTVPLTFANGAEVNPPNCDYWVKVNHGQFQVLNQGQPECVPVAEMKTTYLYEIGAAK
jgi:hypothetical protein